MSAIIRKTMRASVIAAVLAVAILVGAGYWFILRDDDASTEPYVPSVFEPSEKPQEETDGVVPPAEDEVPKEGETAIQAMYGFDKLDLVCFNGGNAGMWDELYAFLRFCWPTTSFL